MQAHEIGQITFVGSQIDDPEILPRLPQDLAALLRETNGFVLFHGGLHVRGAVRLPAWHSLRQVMEGENALHTLYPPVAPTAFLFAEDGMEDKFLLEKIPYGA